MKIKLKVEVKLSTVSSPIIMNIDSQTSLYLFRRHFDVRMSLAEVQAIDVIKMTVEQKTILSTAKATKPRKGKHKMQEKATSDLGTLLYGEGSAGKNQPEGEWDEECDYFMAKDKARAQLSRAAHAPTHAVSPESGKIESLVCRGRCAATSAPARLCTRPWARRTT